MDWRELMRHNPADVVLLDRPPVLARLLSLGRLGSAVPERMGSRQALPWPRELAATLRFSEKNVVVGFP
jgi:hypothetical protein